MVRYYRRRTYTKVVRPKKKWGSNMINVDMQIMNTSQETTSGFNSVALAANKTENNAPTPVIVKTGNFRLQGDIYFTGGNIGSHSFATLYIIFVPQGMEPQNYTAATNLVQNHPEWIMAWKLLDGGFVPLNQDGTSMLDSNRFTVTSRLKRNLNSGDSVFAVIIGENLAPTAQIVLKAKCQFWTCAN